MPTVSSRRVILLGVVLVAALFAQDTGTITGRVADSTGATVAGVPVKLVQVETNFQFAAVTNAEGIYRIQSLLPGTYQVAFEASGFKRVVQSNITLHSGDVLPVNVTLEVGNVTESIQVTAQSTLLETETSSTGTITQGDTLYKLALLQRSITNSMALVPGLTVKTDGGTAGLGAYTVNGQRNTGTAMFEDGMFGVDPLASQLAIIKPIENSVEEVKMLTCTLPAEYGHSASGVISTVKKSGTNELHGMAANYGLRQPVNRREDMAMCCVHRPIASDRKKPKIESVAE